MKTINGLIVVNRSHVASKTRILRAVIPARASLLDQLLGTAPLVHPEQGWWDRISRFKYCLRGLLAPGLTREWFDILGARKLAVIAQNHPHIYSKLQRCYLDRNFTTRLSLLALKNHYQFVAARLSDEALESIYGSSGLLLTRVPLSKADGLELRLRYYDSLSKEGEMSITVHDAGTGGLLAALSFSVLEHKTGSTLAFIGGLQGFTRASQRDRVIEITRGLHGMRPKALLLFALQELAAFWRLNSIRAVSDSRHVYRHYRKRKQVAFSYDKFWLESGGRLETDGLFSMPSIRVPRDLSEMNASKRQMYRRRYAILQELAAQIHDRLALHTLPNAPSNAHAAGDCCSRT